jgi:hypothetical protein
MPPIAARQTKFPTDSFWFGYRKSSFVDRHRNPIYTLALAILEPSRLYCNPRALWKFNWLLRDQYLTCPRRYRHRYLDGWVEKDTRAAMLFGRAFEQALGAYFRREDPGDVLFREW